MATKKEKHAAALARREAFLAEEREIGLKALEVDRKRRAIEMREAWEKGHEKHFKFIDECPLCTEIKKRNAEEARVKAIEKVAAAAKKLATPPRPVMILDTPADGILDPQFSHKVNA